MSTRLELGLEDTGLDDETCRVWGGWGCQARKRGSPPAHLVQDKHGDALLVGHTLELARDVKQGARPLPEGLRV